MTFVRKVKLACRPNATLTSNKRRGAQRKLLSEAGGDDKKNQSEDNKLSSLTAEFQRQRIDCPSQEVAILNFVTISLQKRYQ